MFMLWLLSSYYFSDLRLPGLDPPRTSPGQLNQRNKRGNQCSVRYTSDKVGVVVRQRECRLIREEKCLDAHCCIPFKGLV